VLHFAQPIWLLASAGIIIPVLIHLWNMQSGKTLKVGSIMLLHESQKQNIRSRVPSDIPLLIVRSLLILALCMLLAGPEWKTKTTGTGVKGWVMMEKDGITATYNAFKPGIDSLLAAGYRFHLLDTSLREQDLSSVLSENDSTKHTPYSRWQLITLIDQRLPAGFPVYLFTDNNLRGFTGERPQVSVNLQWQTYTGPDSIGTAVVGIRKTADDSLRLYTLNSRHTGNTISFISMAAKEFEGAAETALKKQITDSSVLNRPDTATLSIAVYTDRPGPEPAYLSAAIKAIANYGKYRVKLSVATQPAELNAQDWVFWLSEKAPPSLPGTPRIFKYETGKIRSTDSWIVKDNGPFTAEPVVLTRYIERTDTMGLEEICWKDGFGHPILTRDNTGSPIYRFYSRFDPSWNGLVWSETFPALLMEMLFPAKHSTVLNPNERRILDRTQMLPQQIGSTKKTDRSTSESGKDLNKIFWIIAFILFVAERIVSSIKRKPKLNA
jgi:hypothetical protein